MQLRVKQILKEKGMKMTDLAAKLGVDQSNLSKSLDGNPTLSRLEEIARVIGVPVRELLPDSPPAYPAGILSMGNRRFALVSLPDETAQELEPLLNAPKLSPGAFQEKIFNLARQCSEDGRTRAFYGFLEGHFVVVIHDGANKRYLRLFWETDGSISYQDYPSIVFGEGGEVEGWKNIQLAELIVHDILSYRDL